MDKRHFTVVEKNGKEHGLYVSSTPSSAAKKAVTKLCSSNKSKKVEFYLREITQGSKKKTYGPYVGEMKKLKTPIELKGRVIQYETIVHLKKAQKSMKGGQFKCSDDTKIIKELCVDDESGEYQDKELCETECLDKKLDTEFTAWRELFNWKPANSFSFHIYCKGGCALGLEVLKSILQLKFEEFTEQLNYTGFVTSNNNNSALKINKYVASKFNEFFEPTYNEFIALNLIKDWDFTVLMTEEHKKKFIEYAKTLDIENQGQSIDILRYKKGLHINQDYLLELSVKTTEYLYDLELPLTNLKFEVNSDNIELFFEIIKMFIKNDKNFDVMRKNLNILINPILVIGQNLVLIENGFYNISDESQLANPKLSADLLSLIDIFLSQQNNQNSNRLNNLAIKQFLITQICQPDRLFLRFFKKNVEKSKKITKFYQDNRIKIPYWLMNEGVIAKLESTINSFLNFLNKYIISKLVIPKELFSLEKEKIQENTKKIKQSFITFIDEMEKLFININFSRLENDKIDIEKIEKLFPILIFSKLKKYSLELKKAKLNEDLQSLNKLPDNHNMFKKNQKSKKEPKTRQQIIKNKQNELRSINENLEKGATSKEIKIDFYLPTKSSKYNSFLRYYLSHFYKNNSLHNFNN